MFGVASKSVGWDGIGNWDEKGMERVREEDERRRGRCVHYTV